MRPDAPEHSRECLIGFQTIGFPRCKSSHVLSLWTELSIHTKNDNFEDCTDFIWIFFSHTFLGTLSRAENRIFSHIEEVFSVFDMEEVETQNENNEISVNWSSSLEEINVEEFVEMHSPTNYSKSTPQRRTFQCFYRWFVPQGKCWSQSRTLARTALSMFSRMNGVDVMTSTEVINHLEQHQDIGGNIFCFFRELSRGHKHILEKIEVRRSDANSIVALTYICGFNGYRRSSDSDKQTVRSVNPLALQRGY